MYKEKLLHRHMLTTSEIETLYGLKRYVLKRAIEAKIITPFQLLNGKKNYFLHSEIQALFVENKKERKSIVQQ